MADRTDGLDARRESMSALVDGQADAQALAAACAAWHEDAQARECWHTYHLIGDVLRSPDMASAPAGDRALLKRVRDRLADEPVVLAPVAPAPAGRHGRWRSLAAPAAVAAGFVAVLGVIVATQVGTPIEPSSLALASHVPSAVRAVAARSVALQPSPPGQSLITEPEFVVANGQLIRDAHLDRYLAAHRQGAFGAAVTMPGTGMRNVDVIVLEDK